MGREIQVDLVSVISAMMCHRIISIFGGIILLCSAITFIAFKFYDSGLLFCVLSLVQFTGFGLSYKYAIHFLTLISSSLIADGLVVLYWNGYFHWLPCFLLVWCLRGIEVEWSHGSYYNQPLHCSSSRCACFTQFIALGHAMLLFFTNSLLPCPHPPFPYALLFLLEGGYYL